MLELKRQITLPNEPDECVVSEFENRRIGIERRKNRACGYTFISSVGWICRREQFRRREDSDMCSSISS
jgi:hypothetical protein